jgi:ABC-type Fe3+-citrate transport system substrate-binding protein
MVDVAELDSQLTGWRIDAALVLATKAESERRRGLKKDVVWRKLSAANAPARRQHQSEDANRGQ